MSNEVAQANEDSSFSNTTANDLPPNTHLEPAPIPGSDTYGMVVSTCIAPIVKHTDGYGRFQFFYGKSYTQL